MARKLALHSLQLYLTSTGSFGFPFANDFPAVLGVVCAPMRLLGVNEGRGSMDLRGPLELPEMLALGAGKQLRRVLDCPATSFRAGLFSVVFTTIDMRCLNIAPPALAVGRYERRGRGMLIKGSFAGCFDSVFVFRGLSVSFKALAISCDTSSTISLTTKLVSFFSSEGAATCGGEDGVAIDGSSFETTKNNTFLIHCNEN